MNGNREINLPSWPDIKVFIEIPKGPVPGSQLTELMLEQYENTPLTNPGDFPYIRPFAYFNFDCGISDPPPILRVRYTKSAWNASIAAGGGGDKPRIFIRKYDTEKESWDGEWKEIDNPRKSKDNIYYYLEVDLPDIPDPAIGGC